MKPQTRTFLEQQILTVREAAELTGVAGITIEKWIERRKLDAVKKGRTLLLERTELEAFMANRGTDTDTQ